MQITVPDDLSELDQWVLWAYRGDDMTKVPFQVNGRPASSTDSLTWESYNTVINALTKEPERYAGIGFVFSPDDPFCGIDLDDCLNVEGNLKPWAFDIVEKFSDTYMEISPSGRGLKIWARGDLPSATGATRTIGGDGQIEMYSRGRYFTVTGRAFRGAPLEVHDHASDLCQLYDHLTRGVPATKEPWPSKPEDDGRIPCGGRHNTLVSFAGTLRARRICDEAIEACLLIINEKQCEKPLPREEVSRIVRSTIGWGKP